MAHTVKLYGKDAQPIEDGTKFIAKVIYIEGRKVVEITEMY